MKIFLLFIIIYCFCLIGCSSKGSSSNENRFLFPKTISKKESLIHIRIPKKGNDPVNISEFADTILYIPLETGPESLLRRIVQLKLTDKYILINSTNKLFLFSKDGKFIRQIGKYGKGPGEYLRIVHFIVVKDTIYISSTGKQSLLIYNIDGNFLKEKPTPFPFTKFNYTIDHNIIAYQRHEGTLIKFDSNLNVLDTIVVEHGVDSDKRRMFVLWDDSDTYFHKCGKRLLFTNYINDTIWDITNGCKKIAYILDNADKLLPWKYQIEYSQGDFPRFIKNATPYQKIYLAETSYYLFLFQKGWTEEDINTIYLLDRASGIIKKGNIPVVFDDLIGKQELTPRYFSHNCLIATLHPYVLKNKLIKKNIQEKQGTDFPSRFWLKQMGNIKEQ
jgi:hypothetical protein